MAECGRKALSLLEAARSRYESLQISDDVFGESGDDSSENPFYSTSGDSNSENCTSESNGDEQRSDDMAGNELGGPPGSVSNIQAEEEGWTDTLREITVPPFKDTCAHQHTQRLRCRLRGSTTLRSPQYISMTTVWIELSRIHLWGLQVGTFHPRCFVD
ncbi:UNVERIFIED_CONTAM: hypothetical protein FKN15_064326 [Acipenser sinensis]